MTMQRLSLLFLTLLVMQGGIFLALMRRWWPQVRAFLLNLHPFQKVALAVCAFGLVTAYFLAFSAGAVFGGSHMSPPRCFTVVALRGDQQVGSTLDCLEERNDGLNVPLPHGVNRVVILDGRARKQKRAP